MNVVIVHGRGFGPGSGTRDLLEDAIGNRDDPWRADLTAQRSDFENVSRKRNDPALAMGTVMEARRRLLFRLM